MIFTKLFVIKENGSIVHWAIEETKTYEVDRAVKQMFGENAEWMIADNRFDTIACSGRFLEVARMCQDHDEDPEWFIINTVVMARACHIATGAAWDISAGSIDDMLRETIEKFNAQ